MKPFALLFSLLSSFTFLNGQSIHNFTITDSDGVEHNLYEDYLDQNKVVMIKFFFSTCPPCNAAAPSVQSLYEQWGSGQGDVEFIELSTKQWDTNANAANYKAQHGLGFPVTGFDGGAYDAALPFIQGNYGTFWGTPSYAVVSPDRSVFYPANGVSGADAAIQSAVDNLNGGPAATSISMDFKNFKNGQNISVPGLSVILKPRNASTPAIDIIALTNGTLAFDYPSADIPEMNDPVVVISSTANAYSSSITPIDLVTIRRHILLLTNMDLPYQTMAADVNGDGKISGSDVVALNKVYLGIETSFPNNVPSYQFLPSILDVDSNPGSTTTIEVNVLKTGDTSLN